MSGARRCKEFLRSLDLEELKNIRVKIKRPNIPEPINEIPRIYRGLDDPTSLVVHFKKESLRGIFDREDIVVNQEFSEENVKKCSRNRERRSSSAEGSGTEERSRNVSYYAKSSGRRKHEQEKKYRSRSRSLNRRRSHRSRSGSYRQSNSPPRRNKSSRRSYSGDRRRSRSFSPRPQVKKTPGLFIPTESDYLKYKKRKTNRSRSPLTSHGSNNIVEHSSRSSLERHRSPRKRSRTRSRDRRSRSSSLRPRRSRRSRSRSRHHERVIEEVGPYGNPKLAPCIFQDGKYWIPVGPAFMPRGYIPPMYPRPFLPPMMMPRMPGMMPYRQRPPRPRQQVPICDVASTSTSVQHSERDSNEETEKRESAESRLENCI